MCPEKQLSLRFAPSHDSNQPNGASVMFALYSCQLIIQHNVCSANGVWGMTQPVTLSFMYVYPDTGLLYWLSCSIFHEEECACLSVCYHYVHDFDTSCCTQCMTK